MVSGHKKYKVLIDLDRLKDLTTGLGLVAQQFGTALARINDPLLDFTFLVPKKFVGHFGFGVDYEPLSLKRRLCPGFSRHYDLWYTIHQDSNWFPRGRTTPYILTINDLNFLNEKSPYKAALRLKRLQKKVDRARYITVISEHTRQAVRDNLNVGPTLVDVVYCGVDVQSFDNPKKPEFVPDGDLLLSIGVLQPKKNYMVLLDFMKQLPAQYKLIIAGNKSHTYAAQLDRRVQELDLNKRVILPGRISDEAKYWMLKNCRAILFPSTLEGMGIPPIEAMRLGKPVFASTCSSIPEICGDHAYYWESFDPESMVQVFLEKMAAFDRDTSLPDKLYRYSLKFSWETNVQIYIALFKKLLGASEHNQPTSFTS